MSDRASSDAAYAHGHRYAFAMELARGRTVLDAACGDGRGTALLARTAGQVLGLDPDPVAIARARAHHGGARQRFEVAALPALPGVAEASIDLVVSFDTLMRHGPADALLAAFARVLKPDGLLLLATPDRHAGAVPDAGQALYREEFEALLARHFPRFRLYGQRVVTHSVLWRLDGGNGATTAYTQDGDELFAGMRALPAHHLAVCAKRGDSLAGLPALSTYADARQAQAHHRVDALDPASDG